MARSAVAEWRLREDSAVVKRAAMAFAATRHAGANWREGDCLLIDASDAMAWPCKHDRVTTDDDLLRFFTV